MKSTSISTLLLVATAFISSAQSYAGTSSDGMLEDRIDLCTAIPESGERLFCFDEIGRSLKATFESQPSAPTADTSAKATSESHSSAPTADTSAKAAVPADKEDSERADKFGTEHLVTPELASINSSISAIGKNSLGKFVVSLENGQVWQMIDTIQLTWKVNDSVEITRGVFNSFFLQKEGGKRRAKAKRIK
jgi:hypothetical protein